MASTTSARRNHPPARSPASPASTENPANPTARRTRFDLSAPGNGCTRVMLPHAVRLGAAPGVPTSRVRSRWARYHGQRRDDVELVAERSRARGRCASSPCRSARCRARSAGRGRRSSRRHHLGGCHPAALRYTSASAAPAAASGECLAAPVPGAPRARRDRRRLDDRVGPRPGSSPATTTAASPTTSGIAARSLLTIGTPSCIASTSGAPKPSYSLGKPERRGTWPTARRGRRRPTRPVRTIRRPAGCAAIAATRRCSSAPAPPTSTTSQSSGRWASASTRIR